MLAVSCRVCEPYSSKGMPSQIRTCVMVRIPSTHMLEVHLQDYSIL